MVKVDQIRKKCFKSENEIPSLHGLPGNQENVLQGKILQFLEKQIWLSLFKMINFSAVRKEFIMIIACGRI